jgi:2,5-diketo-D-gluconate reductase A
MMDLTHKTVVNSSSVNLPPLGFGTFEASPGEDRPCDVAVLAALKAGYRLIDTAALYGSETAVGNAIRESGIPREEIVICTKLYVEVLDGVGQ